MADRVDAAIRARESTQARIPSFEEDELLTKADQQRRRRGRYITVAVIVLVGTMAWATRHRATELLLKAERRIAKDEMVRADDVEVIRVRRGRHPSALPAARREDVVGHVANEMIKEGAFLHASAVRKPPKQ